MGKHDKIVRGLNRKNLCKLLSPYFGEKGCYSPDSSKFLSKEVEEYTFNEIKSLDTLKLYKVNGNDEDINYYSLKDLKEKHHDHKKLIETALIEDCLNIEKKIEFPLIKGEGKFRCTKGYIDLIVHAEPIRLGFYSSFGNLEPIEFVIEVKKKEDLNDVGSIIRQINEYKEYYKDYVCEKYSSNILDNRADDYTKRIWCLLIDEFDESYRDMFEDEDIKIIIFNEE